VALTVGALVQYPIGWISDHTDRRYVVIGLASVTVFAGLWMAADVSPSRTMIGFSVIAAATLPVYSILVAHANDQLTAGQIVPASGTMVFLLNIGLFGGTLIGPNTISMADGRGLQILLIGVSAVVVALAIIRRLKVAAPEDTGALQAVGIIGVAHPGVLQAESWVAFEERAKLDPEIDEES
jgi:hypothetical protein